jgi:hypothetical protein
MKLWMAGLGLFVGLLTACGEGGEPSMEEAQSEAGRRTTGPSAEAIVEAIKSEGLPANNPEDRTDLCEGELDCVTVAIADEISVYEWKDADTAAAFTPFAPCPGTEGQCHQAIENYTLVIGDYTAPVPDPGPYIEVARAVIGQG